MSTNVPFYQFISAHGFWLAPNAVFFILVLVKILNAPSLVGSQVFFPEFL